MLEGMLASGTGRVSPRIGRKCPTPYPGHLRTETVARKLNGRLVLEKASDARPVLEKAVLFTMLPIRRTTVRLRS
jgi:hypothetical protein